MGSEVGSPRCPCCAPASCRRSTRSPASTRRWSTTGSSRPSSRSASRRSPSGTTPGPSGSRRKARDLRRRADLERRRLACSPSPPAPPAARRRRCTSTATCSPSATRSPATCSSPRPTTSSPARRRTPSRSGSAAVLLFPLHAGASTLLVEKATPAELADLIDEHGVTVCFTAPTAYKAMLAAGKSGADPAQGGVRRRAPAEGDLGGVPRRDRRRDHRRHRRDRDAAHLHLGGG